MSKHTKLKPKIHINPETKNSIVAILLAGLSVVLFLAAFDKAGPAGRLIYMGLNYLFGWGYYLVPTISLLVAALFLFNRKNVFIGSSLIGSALFIISGLGLIDIIFNHQGGLIGKVVGMLQVPFGYVVSIILGFVFMAASLLITFNASIKLRKKDEDENEVEETAAKSIELGASEAIVATPASAPGAAALALAEAKTAKAKEKSKKSSEEDPAFSTPKNLNLANYSSTQYVPPPLSLLKSSVEKPTSGDLRANANIIKRTLDSFGIPVEMGEISIGPKVTRYTLKPAEGVKLAKITALNQDLSLALAAHPIRIEAPIPGKSLVGIEVPNKSAAIVRLGSLLLDPEFLNTGPLSFVLGRSVTGEAIFADIERMPHLMIAGATGSGKSVAIHTMILSLLYKNSPATLKLAMIDPKRVELSIYAGLPHLISPVITEGKKAVGLFRWAISEMERRYEILLGAGARDIKSYNQKKMMAKDPDILPFVLIVVDELADLMAAHGREVETSIVRLAQMARATGIHLVVSTQRPSVEVITGLIKANITARVALQVASQVDSRTILDMAGAEKLLGGGDMLFISSDFSKPKRIQGGYVTENEIHEVADFIRANNSAPEIDPNVTDKAYTEPTQYLEGGSGEENDEMYEDAVRVVTEAQKASASLLQRRLSVGYARAARLLDIMEAKGIIGPGDGAKPREVFLNNPVPMPEDNQQ
ncbi:MAG: putative cell division FtsK/SpoIIIE [Parcubacteria group bacterium Gr01-1014_3]|nr:MAG: putative cell division FtsK/SpoIIIE [Parcubacteria group bacterium Gr01-1014_3]